MLIRAMATGAGALLLVFAGTASGNADTVTTRDAHSDVEYFDSATRTYSERSTKIDILRIRVRYENGALVIRTLFRDLTARNTAVSEDATSMHSYRFDTNRERPGLEYRVWNARTENLHRIREGADRLVPCEGISWRANLATDVTTLIVPRSCFRTDERRSVQTRFDIWQEGPGRTATATGYYYVDRMSDAVLTPHVRHSRSG
jgi:hypothetical protein